MSGASRSIGRSDFGITAAILATASAAAWDKARSPRASTNLAPSQGFELIGIEHERWQIKTVAQNVTDTGLSDHRHSVADQRRDVAVNRADRDFKLLRDPRGSDRTASTAENLHQS
jgi:hypothetical protein